MSKFIEWIKSIIFTKSEETEKAPIIGEGEMIVDKAYHEGLQSQVEGYKAEAARLLKEKNKAEATASEYLEKLKKADEIINKLKNPDVTDKFYAVQPAYHIPKDYLDRVIFEDKYKSMYHRVELMCYTKNDDLKIIVWDGVFDIVINEKKYSFGKHKDAAKYLEKCIEDKEVKSIYVRFESRKTSK